MFTAQEESLQMVMTPRAGFALRAGVVGLSVLVTAMVAGGSGSQVASGGPVTAVTASATATSPASPRAVPGLGQVLAVVGLDPGEHGCGGSDAAVDDEVAGRLAAGLPGLGLVRGRGCVTGARLPVEAGQTALLRVEVDRVEGTASLVVADVETPARSSGERVATSGATRRGGSR